MRSILHVILSIPPHRIKPQPFWPILQKNWLKNLAFNVKYCLSQNLKNLGWAAYWVFHRAVSNHRNLSYSNTMRAKNQDTIVFVGKGLTFDSGGICLKQAKDMDQMKSDMSGGAAVLGAIKAISRMKLPQHIVGLIPCTENMPSGSAIKPGDIIKFRSGKTAEVANTDAEGRLILADALDYAGKYKPSAVIDLATLTGSCVVALGTAASGMMGNNEELKKRVKTAGEKNLGKGLGTPPLGRISGANQERYCRHQKYRRTSCRAITAACFLSKFTEKYPWVHLDIAGTSWCEKIMLISRKALLALEFGCSYN